MALIEKYYEVWFYWSICSLAGRSVSLGFGFGILKIQARPSVSQDMLDIDPDLELSATTFQALYLPACHAIPCHEENRQNF